MTVPPAYQVPAPFGTNVGGANPSFWDFSPTAQYDSWLTVGETAGNVAQGVSSIGVKWDTWTEDLGLTIDDGAVFWMAPDDAPLGPAVVAQLTMPSSV